MAFSFLNDALQQRQSKGLLRQEQCVERYDSQHIEVAGRTYINFSSNDYLGLAQLPTPEHLFSLPKGSGGSPLVTGFSAQHQALSDYLAQHLNREAVLLLGAGFSANKAIMSALGEQGSVSIIADKLAHASIIEGGLASKAEFKRFRHNDVAHCERLLLSCSDMKDKSAQHSEPCVSSKRTTEIPRNPCLPKESSTLLVTESVFSMDGDEAPMAALSSLSEQTDAWLCVDDAHGFGVLGQSGLGIVEKAGLSQSQLPIIMGTFGKAIGTGGAFIAGSRALIDYIRQFSKDYIYSTAFSPFHAALTLHHLHQCKEDHWRREKLSQNISLFQNLMASVMAKYAVKLLPSQTAIQPLIIGQPEKALQVANALRESGYWVTAIRQPTVPKNTDRLRITLTTMHQPSDITGLVLNIEKALIALP